MPTTFRALTLGGASCAPHSSATRAGREQPDTVLSTPASGARGISGLFSPSPSPFIQIPVQNAQWGYRIAMTEWHTPGTEPPAGPHPRGTSLLPANNLLGPTLRRHSCRQTCQREAYQPLCSGGPREPASCSRSAGQLSSLKCPAQGFAHSKHSVNGRSLLKLESLTAL